jgi:Flp pilus assembly protein protease CpaA
VKGGCRFISVTDISSIPAISPPYHEQPMLWLFIYTLAISLYDLRTGRIPNWCTLPLIIAGLIAHFPGSLDLWLANLILSLAWTCGWMGAGDVKLWMGVLWAQPSASLTQALPIMFITFFLTSLAQILWRLMRKQSTVPSLTPAAWRTIPFVLLLWYVH